MKGAQACTPDARTKRLHRDPGFRTSPLLLARRIQGLTVGSLPSFCYGQPSMRLPNSSCHGPNPRTATGWQRTAAAAAAAAAGVAARCRECQQRRVEKERDGERGTRARARGAHPPCHMPSTSRAHVMTVAASGSVVHVEPTSKSGRFFCMSAMVVPQSPPQLIEALPCVV